MNKPDSDAGIALPIVRTGTANLAAVRTGLERLSHMGSPVRTTVTVDAAMIRHAHAVVLPGVGAFGAVMNELHALGLVEPLRDRIASGRPTLCVCLGMQILTDASEESPGAAGLGVAKGTVRRFAGGGGLRVPQMGWNAVTPDPGARLLMPGDAYFANSYRLSEAPEGWACAWSTHGDRFIAAMQRGCVLACQFHPELSGPWGSALLQRWLDFALSDSPAAAPRIEETRAC